MSAPEDMTRAALVAYVRNLKNMIHSLQAEILRLTRELDPDHDSHDETTYPQHP